MKPFLLISLGILFFPSGRIESADDVQSDWKKTDPIESRMKRHTKPIYSIVIHHTETPNEAARLEINRLRSIQSFHTGKKAWGDIAYHYLIGPSGKIYEGRTSHFQGDSGTSYDLNGRLLICVLGSFTDQLPVAPALDSLTRFVKSKVQSLNLDITKHVTTHRDVASTDCPGDTFHKWITNGGLIGSNLKKPDTEINTGRIHSFSLGDNLFRLEIPPGFEDVGTSRKEDLYRLKIRSQEGQSEFAVTIGLPKGETIDWPPRKEGEIITTEDKEGRLVVTGPGQSYTRYFRRNPWGEQEHPVLWEFFVKDPNALNDYREIYSAFKKSLKYDVEKIFK